MSITSMTNRARMAENLTIDQLQQSIQDGVVPSYIGVPLLKSKVEDAKLLQAAKAAQNMGQQPSVAQQIMSQAQQVSQPAPQMAPQAGVEGLSTNLPAAMAGGGIVAFAEGGMYDEEDSDEDRQDAARQAEMDEMMDEYAQSFQQGIGQLPAAQQYAPAAEGKEDTSDFIARIMHKESRGQRYGKDGKLLTSEKGAQGEMQVMPGTSRDPGFGVKAARDGSPDELARVGRDYANTLLQRYGDPKLAAIAYNMGPGATDKWLAAGADVSKLPKETQGYVKGFAEGGSTDDYSTVDGMEPSDLYAEAIKRAKAERAQKTTEKEQLTDSQKKYAGLWPYNAPEAGKFSYEDAAKFDARKREDAPAAAPTAKPGITYAPNSGIGNVTPTRYVPKESNEPQSEYARQMGNVGGFFGDAISSLGKHIVSAPGYGFSSQGRPEGRSAAPVAQNIPDIPRGRPAMANDPRLIGAAQPSAQGDGMEKDVALNSRIDKMMPSAASAAPADAPAKPDQFAKFEELFAKREENLAKQREQDKYMAMLQAGLGMMGGTSQHALANIGAGASQGIQSLAQSNKDRTAEENALLSGRLGLAKIGGAKEQAEAMMQLRRDLQKDALTQRGDQARATEAGRTESRENRIDAKQIDYIKSAKESALTQATKLVNSGTAAMTMTDEQKAEAVQNTANKLLMGDDMYRSYVTKQNGKDPFGAGASGMDQLGLQMKSAFGSYEPSKYDYRMVDGRPQRKLKE